MKLRISLLSFFLTLSLLCLAQKSKKREFRGAWIQTAFQSQYTRMQQDSMQNYFIKLLDNLKECKINAVIFQMRPSADAFYLSDVEPVSRFLTGTQGVWNQKQWDPALFVLEECHKRNIEFHAWLNPYRVTTSATETLHPEHIYFKHPSWFVEYGGKKYFDPGQPQCRKFYRDVIIDIATRYDVDGIHMDDYFYPYPIAGVEFPDEASFLTYHEKQGFSENERDDWRRSNVDILIKSIHEDLILLKPWVRFGISPFGIYRNNRSWAEGSKTNGLQNYDDLYADVLKWTENGWIDYLIPQLYWEIGHTAADYTTLCNWWNKHNNDIPLYIGQSISRSLDQGDDLSESDDHFSDKIEQTRELEFIDGNCFWYGYQIDNNEHKIADVLKDKYHKYEALIPQYERIDTESPDRGKRPRTKWDDKGYKLYWDEVKDDNPMQDTYYYCVYSFPRGEKKDFDNPKYLVATTKEPFYYMPYKKTRRRHTYYVTVVDRMHNESKPSKRQRVRL